MISRETAVQAGLQLAQDLVPESRHETPEFALASCAAARATRKVVAPERAEENTAALSPDPAAKRFAEALFPEQEASVSWKFAYSQAIQASQDFRSSLKKSRREPDILSDPDFLKAFFKHRSKLFSMSVYNGELFPDDTPEAVRLFYDGSHQDASGVFVSSRHLLTAAHTLPREGPQSIKVEDSLNNLYAWDGSPPILCSEPLCSIDVPDGTLWLRDGPDLALIRLKEEHSVPVPDLPDTQLTQSIQSQPVVAIGFGITPASPVGEYGGSKPMIVLPFDNCRTRDCSSGPNGPYICQPDLEFVAGTLMHEGGICKGDSGGPVYKFDGENWSERQLVGLNARSLVPGKCGNGGYFTRLDGPTRDWIEETIENWPEPD